jgi:hypothetical protein
VDGCNSDPAAIAGSKSADFVRMMCCASFIISAGRFISAIAQN